MLLLHMLGCLAAAHHTLVDLLELVQEICLLNQWLDEHGRAVRRIRSDVIVVLGHHFSALRRLSG